MKKYPHAIVIVTLTCNLKCKNCILCAPYYKEPFHPTVQYIEETAERAFRLGSYEIFEYMGGEPLLRKDFPEIWEYNRKHFFDRADIFKTATNGSILISDALIDVWKTYGEKIHIIVDDYGPDLSPKAPENIEKLQRSRISCELRDMYSEKRHHGGWVDFIAT
ncbi:MAG: radical SAM protein, partial [Oscillospiraceae bacterium]|nr:radical SAM protein [Oscillospiraceae bacterium]